MTDSDTIYFELMTLFREKLLPLNFQEGEEIGLGENVTFTRGQSKLSFGIEYRDQIYYFDTDNPNFHIHQFLPEGDKFKAEVIKKFEVWLAKQ